MSVNAHAVATAYIAAVNAADCEALSHMFAPDALFLGPDGLKRTGRQAIGDFYRQTFLRGRPNLQVGRLVAEGRRISFELVGQASSADPDDAAMAIDLIELD